MKTYILASFLFLLCKVSASQPAASSWYTIKGFLPQWNNAMVSIDKEDGHMGSGPVVNDMFSFTGKCSEPFPAHIRLSKNGKNLVLAFFVEPGTIRIRAKSEFNCYVYGTSLNDAVLKFENDADSAAGSNKLSDIRDLKRLNAASFIKQNPGSPVSLRLLNEYYYLDPGANDSVYYALYNSLDPVLKNSSTGQKTGEEATARFTTSIGRTAPCISLINESDLEERMYEQGKVTLIHFWATWCVPCRQELQQIQRIFSKFKDNDLQVIMISLDRDRKQWKLAAGMEHSPWKQLIDPGGFDGSSAKSYGVKTIPANFLLDDKGRIIARHASVDEIERQLSKLNNKPPASDF